MYITRNNCHFKIAKSPACDLFVDEDKMCQIAEVGELTDWHPSQDLKKVT